MLIAVALGGVAQDGWIRRCSTLLAMTFRWNDLHARLETFGSWMMPAEEVRQKPPRTENMPERIRRLPLERAFHVQTTIMSISRKLGSCYMDNSYRMS